MIGGNRPGRPGIGGGNTIIGGGNNINIGNNVVNRPGNNNLIGHHPNWDRPNWNRPGWGWGGGDWHDHWHNNAIHNHHHNWYNGCWHGYWGSAWYAPVVWGGVGWGLGALTSGWGYGGGYYNPYYAQPVATVAAPYDYSQPVVVNNYVSSDSDATGGTSQATQQDSPETQQGLALFDEGLGQFKAGDYAQALTRFNAALKLMPGDPVIHEVRALTLFALGNYKDAAASLNSLLSSAPGMDWTTVSGLYGNTDDYSAQLRKLEQHCRANPKDASSAFVLAYHYLVTGAKDEAINALKAVVKNEPKDITAKRMLDALVPPAPPEPAPPPPPAPEATAAKPAEGDAPETDLVGIWRAKASGTTIELTVTEDSKFTWKATQTDKPAIELAGDLNATGSSIVLESKDQGSMAGIVTSKGPDKWQFKLDGAPASDPGLTFERVKS